MDDLEALSNKADALLDQCHEALLQGTCPNIQGQPLFRKLAAIYAEEASKAPRVKCVSQTHRLLEKLVKKEHLSCLIIRLYPGNEGFTLAVKMSSGIETVTVPLPYDDCEFLSYIDNEQLPPMILDLLDEANLDIFHAGCIIAELRDHRKTTDCTDSRFILLRPTNQSLLADIAAMTRDKDWTPEERLNLEAELVNRTAPPLNLSPSPIVTIVNNKIHQHKYKFSTVPLKRATKRYSQVAQNRHKKFEEGPAPKSLKLLNFLNSKKDKRPIAKTIPKPMIPMILEELDGKRPELKFSADVGKFYQSITEDVVKHARAYEKPHDNTDNSLIFIEEYTLETESEGRIYLTKVTISQRKTDEIFFGELYVDRDYQEGKQNGSTCKFQLGSQHQVRRYIQQFKEIFTEEGRKSVKITHHVNGQPPMCVYTQGSRDKKELAKQQQQQQLQQQQQQALQQTLMTVGNTQQVVNASGSIAVNSVSSSTVHTVQSVATTPQQSLLIVSNGEGGLKKSVTMVTKPVTMTSSSLLNSQVASSGAQVVVGPKVLSNLLSGRSSSAGVSGGMIMTQTPQGVVATSKITSTGGVAAKFSMPSLAAQLSRPAPSYSQAVSPQISRQVPSYAQAVSPIKQVKVSADSSTNHAPGLKALLDGTPSADNPPPQPRAPTLVERLQSTQPGIFKTEDRVVKVGGSPGVLKVGTSPLGSTTGLMKVGSSPVVNVGTAPGIMKVGTSPNTSCGISTSAVATVLRSDSGTAGPPPNINIANITNLPGLNVGLPNLQNVQVSIGGVPVPISLSLNVPGSGATTTASIVISSASLHNSSKGSGTTTVSSAATVMIASPSSQVVQLPISQLSGSQLAAQLTKSGGTVGTTSSTIPILQVQGVGGQLFTSVRGMASSGSVVTTTTAAIQPQTVQVSLPASQAGGLTAGDLQLHALPNKGSQKLNLQLQQKLMAVKKNRQQQ